MEPDRSAAPSDSLAGDLVLPPSAGTPRASLPGHAPDTVRPEGIVLPDTMGFPSDTGRHLASSQLDVDSIAATYRDHYRSEFIDHHQLPPGEPPVMEVDPEIVAATRRRTALQFGYVDLDGWESLVDDLSESQRADLARLLDAFHRSLGNGI